MAVQNRSECSPEFGYVEVRRIRALLAHRRRVYVTVLRNNFLSDRMCVSVCNAVFGQRGIEFTTEEWLHSVFFVNEFKRAVQSLLVIQDRRSRDHPTLAVGGGSARSVAREPKCF